MTITSSIVLLSVFWFIILFVVLPINITTQKDIKDIVPGTAPSSPVHPNLKKKFYITTLTALLTWIPACFIINIFMK